jgi:hypothetical protein
MPRLRFDITTVLALTFTACLGGFIGFVASFIFQTWSLSSWKERVHVLPLPHHFPKYPDGIRLRFAMVHDVLHERYARHGKDYYDERNRQVNVTLKGQGADFPPTEKNFALLDDLGVGLDSIGDHDGAVRVLRDKLKRQLAKNYSGRQLYTTYANLGTFLIHGSAQQAIQGNAASKQQLREGLAFIKKAIDVNPQAHFGREIWQAVIVEFTLAAIENPGLLLKYDMIGDSLSQAVDPGKCRSYQEMWSFWGRDADPAKDSRPAEVYRNQITNVGGEADWEKDVHSSQPKPVPFDEPTLGIVGMWRLGGGANPHFALALGEIMTRVGQRYIAWCAYERATRLVEHCRKRQQLIAEQLPPLEMSGMLARFEAELRYGMEYQKAYAAFEADQIRAGASIDDPHVYDAFHAQHEPIESPVGEADRFVGSKPQIDGINPAPIVLFAGIFSLATALFLRFKDAC